ncbi:MAG: LPXTG cell wall anchor domain-containing protein, partial [Gemella haemolysans]|uniref:SIALI-17 repeat-containing surface protein n=1 Tax=Gemella haemolysans TaxID=1379 RepID=UPI0026EC451B
EFNGPIASNVQDAPVNKVPEFNGPAASNGQDAPINNVPEFTGGVNDTTPPTVPDKPEGETPKPTKPETSNGDSLVQLEVPEFKGGVNAVEAAVNEIPTFGAKQPEIKKILDELVNIKDQIKDGEENGAEDYYINGLKDRLADLEKAFDLLTQNLSAVNEVPEYTDPVTSEPQPHVEGTAPGSGQGGTAGEIVDPNQNLGSVGGASATQDVDFGQTPAVTQLSEKPEEAKPAKAKSKALASTGMNSSSTTALGLSLICLIGLVVRRKLFK